jgi:hypothetical protein
LEFYPRQGCDRQATLFCGALLLDSTNNMKDVLGVIAVIITFVGYIPYIKDILNRKTRPHIYSWFLWGFVGSIVFALQISDKAGAGALVTLAAVILCVVVLGLGLKLKGKRDIKFIDTVFFILALVGVAIWILAKQPIISAILLTIIDLLGFVPTIRKSWLKPYSETLVFYILNTIRFVLAIASLQRYSIITALYPITWFFANSLFALMLVIRRKQLGRK